MKDHPEQLMFQSRDIAMTPEEQAVMRRKLLAYTFSKPARIPAVGVFAWMRRHAIVASALGVALVLGATGVSASMAGPNDALYDFKLKVNDRIEAALAVDEDAKLDIELRQIERQLDAEELGAQEALADDDQDETTSSPTVTPKQELNSRDDGRKNLKAEINAGTRQDGKDDAKQSPAERDRGDNTEDERSDD